MLIAAAVCPHPPLLIPAALGAAGSEPPAVLRAVAEACDAAVHALVAAEPDLIAVVGGGPADHEYEAGAARSLSEFGVPVTVGDGDPVLPLSLTVGRWLLSRAWTGTGPQDHGQPRRGRAAGPRDATPGAPEPLAAGRATGAAAGGRPAGACR